MARKLTDQQVEEIKSLRRLPQRTIAKRVGCSVGSVNAILGAPAPVTKPRTKAKKPESRPPPATEAPATDVARDDAPDEDVETSLRESLTSLRRATAQAESDKDVARVVQASRAAAQVAGLLQRAMPPRPVALDERLDVKEAAERGRKRMHELLDRLLKAQT